MALAQDILRIHRDRTYVVDEESYAEDSHALILWEIDAAHYALLCLTISTFKESLGINQSLDDIVLI